MTARRTKTDFVRFIGQLVEKVYAGAQKIHLVMDNLNTHFHRSFVEVLGIERAEWMLERVECHYTPKHASWLNMAEIEIGIMDRQCTGRRLASEAVLQSGVTARSTVAIKPRPELNGSSHDKMPTTNYLCTMSRN